MKADPHETIRHIIDKTLAGAVSPQEERSLRGHLQACAQCQKYLSASTRVITSLGGFSFDLNPELKAKVCASLSLRAQQLEVQQPSHRRMAWICIVAFMFTVGGSFIELQFGGLIAAVLQVQSAQVQHVLLTFWIAPSLCFPLLFPILPLLLAASPNRKGSIQ